MRRLSALLLIFSLALPLAAGAAVPYTAQITGVDDELRSMLAQVSDTIAMTKEPPASLVHLQRRVERDRARFLKALQSLAYYGAEVQTTIDEDATPVQVTFDLTPGPQYRVSLVELQGAAEDEIHLPTPEELGLNEGRPATAEAILDAEARLLRRLRNAGHPFAEAPDRDVIVDHNTQKVEITYKLEPGPEAVFDGLQIEGLESVKEARVRELIPFESGETYSQQAVSEAQTELYESGLFSSVRIKPVEPVGDDGAVTMNITVDERKHRTIAVGVEYETGLGPAATVRWEHRNIAGMGRKLNLELQLSRILYEFDARFERDHWRRPDQALAFEFEAAIEERDAFDSDRIVTRAWMDRELNEDLTVSAGLAIRLSRVQQGDVESSYRLIGVPLQLTHDTTDDLLNATTGHRLRLQVAPYIDFFGGDSEFVHNELNFSSYFRSDEEATWVLAMRTRLGIIASYSLDEVPPDVRFFSGGGGSVRGYPYQEIGPQLDDGPLGGRSVIEAAVELRRKLNDSLAVAAFVDGGTVFAPAIPDFGERFRFGAGVGIRYLTPVGPLRFDFAVPLNPPDHIDSDYQIYLSVGQAF